MNPIRAGEPLPKIALPDQDRNIVDVASLQDRVVLLSFHPLAWTGVCTRQMESLEMNADVFKRANAFAVGISVDPVPSKKAWANSMHIEKTRLLSDFWPHGKAARDLGLFRKMDGFSQRAAVLVDPDGIICFVKIYELNEVPNVDELIEKIQAISRGDDVCTT